ncbi:hypothetical protein AU381_13580 [Sinorhizobium glycinis]|uniref:Methyl-accepting transducer domain-containing protein n=1 Tax=Sinorhizobium glycinis TaxID=1472378 RepID=A0A178XRA2_9HYPH|nr:methyl-accepting chemotaxis protein [Sinorhizobium glycinis]OAP37800.1 hypothetical protein AU381_13580 [Sinorhizobium glycinis]
MQRASGIVRAAESIILPHGAGSADAIGSRLTDIVRCLSAPRRDMEATFLGMTQSLAGCVPLLGEISTAHEQVAASLCGGDFAKAVARLERIRIAGAGIGSEGLQNGSSIDRLQATIVQVEPAVSSLSTSVRIIGFVAVNARIQAAGIRDQSEDFSIFATDMAELTRNAAATVKAFSEQYQRLIASLEEAVRVNTAFAAEHSGTMGVISSRLGQYLETIDGHRQRLTGKTADHGQLRLQITSRIGAAVAALQIGDITRQRIEHAEQALEALDGLLRTIPEGDTDRRNGAIAAICGLQVAQLEEATADLGREAGDLTSTLNELAGDAETILTHGAEEAEHLLASGGTAISAMVEDLREICALLGAFTSMRDDLDRLTSDVSRTVAAMVEDLEKVRRIEEDLRHLGLNTAIKCGRFGNEGRTLNVIAQELRMLTEQTGEATKTIITGLEEAAQLVSASPAAAARGTTAELESEAREVLECLASVTAGLGHHVGCIVKTGPSVMRVLDGVVSEVKAHEQMERHVNAGVAEIRMVLGEVPEEPGQSFLPLELLKVLRAGYSMDSERLVHDRMFGDSTLDTRGTEQPTEDTADLSDILF